LSKAISGSMARPIFTNFSTDYWLDPLSDRSGDIAMATNFRVKMGELGRLTFIRRFGIPKRSGISQFRFQKVYLRWSGYIVWKFDELWSSNSGVRSDAGCRAVDARARVPDSAVMLLPPVQTAFRPSATDLVVMSLPDSSLRSSCRDVVLAGLSTSTLASLQRVPHAWSSR